MPSGAFQAGAEDLAGASGEDQTHRLRFRTTESPLPRMCHRRPMRTRPLKLCSGLVRWVVALVHSPGAVLAAPDHTVSVGSGPSAVSRAQGPRATAGPSPMERPARQSKAVRLQGLLASQFNDSVDQPRSGLVPLHLVLQAPLLTALLACCPHTSPGCSQDARATPHQAWW